MQTPYDPPMTPLQILHEDADIVVVDKPAGLLSVPGRGPHLADCLSARVEAVFPTALVVHRLDRDTSGVLIFALSPHAQRTLQGQFATRRTQKRYVARVWGQPSEDSGTVDLPLIVDWPNRPLQKICHETGKPAVTDWKVVKREGTTARLHLVPHTGRTHQLRVHAQALGHPILGDPFYAEGEGADFSRMMLHAEELRVKHPQTEKSIKFRAAAPF